MHFSQRLGKVKHLQGRDHVAAKRRLKTNGVKEDDVTYCTVKYGPSAV